MKPYLLFIILIAGVLAAGCTSTTTASIDPITGNWLYRSTYNNTTIDNTLVFDDSGYFNDYFLGSLTLSGHWTKINATAYEVSYDNKTTAFVMSGDKTRIWDAALPEAPYTKL
jgi:hypothetical protein